MRYYVSVIRNNYIAKMVKFDDRLYNIFEKVLMPYDFKQFYIKETVEWYLPLAKDTVF